MAAKVRMIPIYCFVSMRCPIAAIATIFCIRVTSICQPLTKKITLFFICKIILNIVSAIK